MTSDKMISFDILYQKLKSDFLNTVFELKDNGLIELDEEDFKIYKDSDEYINSEIADEFDPERSKITRLLFKNWGGTLSQNKNIDAYDQTVSVNAFWPESIREDITTIFNKFVSDQAGKVYSINNNDGEKFICLVQCPDLPDYTDPVEAEGDYKAFCSFVITVNLIKGLTLSNDQELYIDEILVPFSEMTVNRSFEQKANLKNNQDENEYTNIKSTFNISIDGLSTENKFTDKLWNSLYSPEHLTDTYNIRLGRVKNPDGETPDIPITPMLIDLNANLTNSGILEYSIILNKKPSSGYGILTYSVYNVTDNIFILDNNVEIQELETNTVLSLSDALEVGKEYRVDLLFTCSDNFEGFTAEKYTSAVFSGLAYYDPIIEADLDTWGFLTTSVKSLNLPTSKEYTVEVKVIDDSNGKIAYIQTYHPTTSNFESRVQLWTHNEYFVSGTYDETYSTNGTSPHVFPNKNYHIEMKLTAIHNDAEKIVTYTSETKRIYDLIMNIDASITENGLMKIHFTANRTIYNPTDIVAIPLTYRVYRKQGDSTVTVTSGTLNTRPPDIYSPIDYTYERNLPPSNVEYLCWVEVTAKARDTHPELQQDDYVVVTAKSEEVLYSPVNTASAYSLRTMAIEEPEEVVEKVAGPYKMIPTNIAIKYVQDSVISYSVDFTMSM